MLQVRNINASSCVVNPRDKFTDWQTRDAADRADALASDSAWFAAHPTREWRARRAREFELSVCVVDNHMQGVVFICVPRCEHRRPRNRFPYLFQAPINFDTEAVDDRWCAQIAAARWAKFHQCDHRPVLISQ